MKYKRPALSVGMLAISIALTVLLASPAQGLIYKVEQDGLSEIVEPVKKNQDAASFYDFSSASAHTPFVEDSVAKLYLYEDLGTGVLSLVMHHHLDEEPPDDPGDIMRADFDFVGVPAGVTVAVSDDPDHQWDPPRGQELDLTAEPEGHWSHGENSDGGVLSGFSTSQPWSINITPSNWLGIKEWRYVDSDSSEFVLDMSKAVTISAVEEIPTLTEWGMIIFCVLLFGWMAWVIVRRRRRVTVGI